MTAEMIIAELREWFDTVPPEFAFLLALPFVIAIAALMQNAIERKTSAGAVRVGHGAGPHRTGAIEDAGSRRANHGSAASTAGAHDQESGAHGGIRPEAALRDALKFTKAPPYLDVPGLIRMFKGCRHV